MEGALVHRAVAEEHERDALLLLVLDGEADARRHDELAADDGLAAEQVVLVAPHVHRAALALADAGGLAEQFGHHGLRLHALEDGVAVLAVGAEDVVFGLERGEGADAVGLLADVEVEEAADLAEGIFLGGLLLEAAQQHHLLVHVQQLLAGQSGQRHRSLANRHA